MLTLIDLIRILVTNTSVNSRSTGPALLAGGWAIAQLWLFWLALLAGAILGALDKVAAGGIVESPDRAATASDLAEVWRG